MRNTADAALDLSRAEHKRYKGITHNEWLVSKLSDSFYVWLKKVVNGALKLGYGLFVGFRKNRKLQLEIYCILSFVCSLSFFLLPTVLNMSSFATSFYFVFFFPLSIVFFLYSVYLFDKSTKTFSEAKKATSHNIPKFKDDFRKVVCKKCTSQVYYDTIRVFGNKCPDCGSVLPITKKELNIEEQKRG